MKDFPILDLAQFANADAAKKQDIGAEVDLICRETGFLAVQNHAVAPATIDAVWQAARGFFDQPMAVKQNVAAAGAPYGYLGPGTEALAKSRGEKTPPDLKESFNGGPQSTPAGMVTGGRMFQPVLMRVRAISEL